MLLTGITFITTYNCNANCAHCFFDTQADKKYMSPEVIDIVYEDISVTEKMFWNHFSGGEVLLEQNTFLDIIKRTRTYFKGDIGISTNAFWATSKAKASQLVFRLAEAGVSGIAVSSDYFHTPFIPTEYVSNAVQAIQESGLKTHSYIMGAHCNSDVKLANYCNSETEKLAHVVKGNSEMKLAPTQIRSIGKGSNINIPKKLEIPTGACADLSECLGKRGPLNPAMVWIDPYGNVMICYGIIIGNIYENSFSSIINNYSEESFPILSKIAKSPYLLYKEAIEKGLTKEKNFYDVCDVCFIGRKKLMQEYPLIFGPKECYP